MLHPQESSVAFVVDRLEDIAVIDLAGKGIFTTRNITDLEVSNFVPVLADVVDQVAFTDLLVIDIEQDLHVFAPNRLHDFVSFG